jgi:ABC-type phosphate/phosphonate transport system ATPase subunit
VELFARLFDVPRRGRTQRVEEALAAMGLTEPAGRLVKTYSGGMVRRLELAQALVNAPRLLILDEPTVGIDPIARSDVWEHITRLRERLGMTAPTPRSALITGKAFAAGLRSLVQGVVIVVLAAILGVAMTGNPLNCWPPPAWWCWARRSSPACRCRSRAWPSAGTG